LDLPSLNAATAARVQNHLAGIGRDAERWIADGIARIPQENGEGNGASACPFCAQDLSGSELITHYRSYFDIYKRRERVRLDIVDIYRRRRISKETAGDAIRVSNINKVKPDPSLLCFSAGRISKITDPSGSDLNYSYNLAGDLASFTDRERNTTNFSYNATHGLLTIMDPRGIQPIRNDYDTDGRLISHTDAFNHVITYTYSLATNHEEIGDRLGYTTAYEYDANGNVLERECLETDGRAESRDDVHVRRPGQQADGDERDRHDYDVHLRREGQSRVADRSAG
jgi:YD repeat-containing protein